MQQEVAERLRELRGAAGAERGHEPVRRGLLLLLSCGGGAVRAVRGAEPDAQLLFRDIRAEAGIGFPHHSAPEKKFIVESMSGGSRPSTTTTTGASTCTSSTP